MQQPAASSAGVPSDEQIADAIPTTATILPGEPRKVCMTRMELRQFIAALAQREPVQVMYSDDAERLIDQCAQDWHDWQKQGNHEDRAAWLESRRAAIDYFIRHAAPVQVGNPGAVSCSNIAEPRNCYRVRCQLGKKCVEPTQAAPSRSLADGKTH